MAYVLNKSLDYYRYKTIEEMSELTKELCKNSNGKDNLEHIAEEIADVQLILEQLIAAYDCEDLVQTMQNIKLNRFDRRYNKG